MKKIFICLFALASSSMTGMMDAPMHPADIQTREKKLNGKNVSEVFEEAITTMRSHPRASEHEELLTDPYAIWYVMTRREGVNAKNPFETLFDAPYHTSTKQTLTNEAETNRETLKDTINAIGTIDHLLSLERDATEDESEHQEALATAGAAAGAGAGSSIDSAPTTSTALIVHPQSHILDNPKALLGSPLRDSYFNHAMRQGELNREKDLQEQTEAATKIQALARGYLVRNKNSQELADTAHDAALEEDTIETGAAPTTTPLDMTVSAGAAAGAGSSIDSAPHRDAASTALIVHPQSHIIDNPIDNEVQNRYLSVKDFGTGIEGISANGAARQILNESYSPTQTVPTHVVRAYQAVKKAPDSETAIQQLKNAIAKDLQDQMEAEKAAQALARKQKLQRAGLATGALAGIGITDLLATQVLKDLEAFSALNGKVTKNLTRKQLRALNRRLAKQMLWVLGALSSAGLSTVAAYKAQGKGGLAGAGRTAALLAVLTALEQAAKFGGRKALEARARRNAAHEEAAEQPQMVPAKAGA
jgi:hypothetical protein